MRLDVAWLLLIALAAIAVACGARPSVTVLADADPRFPAIATYSEEGLNDEEVTIQARGAEVRSAQDTRTLQDERARMETIRSFGYYSGAASIALSALLTALWVAAAFYAPLRPFRSLFLAGAVFTFSLGSMLVLFAEYFHYIIWVAVAVAALVVTCLARRWRFEEAVWRYKRSIAASAKTYSKMRRCDRMRTARAITSTNLRNH